jgi:hypothetical protein
MDDETTSAQRSTRRRPRTSGKRARVRLSFVWLELCKVAQTSGVGKGPTAQSQSQSQLQTVAEVAVLVALEQRRDVFHASNDRGVVVCLSRPSPRRGQSVGG